MNDASGTRPEAVIAEVYRQIRLCREAGRKPVRVVMAPAAWALVEDYRKSLGSVNGPVPDYLSKDGLFGLEVWYGDGPEVVVE